MTQSEKRNVRVSVAMITYNHARFISQAIDSVLSQLTDFEFEVVIGDDASNDGTDEIVRSYQDRFPGLITVICHKRNVGMHRNLEAVLNACQGEYIALLEGDDYWCNSDKLSRQVSLLDADTRVGLVFSDAIVVNTSGSEVGPSVRPTSINSIQVRDLIKQNCITTCTTMFRRKFFPRYPKWFHSLKLADWPMWLLISKQGKVVFIPEILGCYRVHSQGVWSPKSDIFRTRAVTSMLLAFNKSSTFIYHKEICAVTSLPCHVISNDARAGGSRRECIKFAFLALVLSLWVPDSPRLVYARLLCEMLPGYRTLKPVIKLINNLLSTSRRATG